MAEGRVSVVVAWSAGPRQVQERALSLAAGATVADALAAAGASQPDASVSLWGRKVPLHRALRDGDRIELCRPLRVDPKVARRERFSQQGARNSGLFARRRPGAKPGY